MRSARGITLIESVIASLIVGVAAVSAVTSAAAALKRRADATARGVAEALAAELAAELARLPYEESGGCAVLGPDAGESARSDFDDCDDANGWTETQIAGRGGATVQGLSGFSRAVAVAWAEPADPVKESAGESGLKRIEVVASWNGRPMARSVVWRSRAWEEATE